MRCGLSVGDTNRGASTASAYAYAKRDPEGNDRGGKLLPIIQVSRSEISDELDISAGNPEFETDKEPLSATICKARAVR
jgi:hypothetical protein